MNLSFDQRFFFAHNFAQDFLLQSVQPKGKGSYYSERRAESIRSIPAILVGELAAAATLFEQFLWSRYWSWRVHFPLAVRELALRLNLLFSSPLAFWLIKTFEVASLKERTGSYLSFETNGKTNGNVFLLVRVRIEQGLPNSKKEKRERRKMWKRSVDWII